MLVSEGSNIVMSNSNQREMKTISVRVPSDMKEALQTHYSKQGKTLSEGTRQLYVRELSKADATQRLSAIFESAQHKVDVSGLLEPSEKDIDVLIAKVRAQRAAEGLS